MGARPGLDFIRRKWLHVIINDDFLEEGECYDRALLPSIICLGRLRIASKYIYNLWQQRQRVDSLAQWLEHWIFNREDRVRIPGKTEYFFSYASFLCYDFHVVRMHKQRSTPTEEPSILIFSEKKQKQQQQTNKQTKKKKKQKKKKKKKLVMYQSTQVSLHPISNFLEQEEQPDLWFYCHFACVQYDLLYILTPGPAQGQAPGVILLWSLRSWSE